MESKATDKPLTLQEQIEEAADLHGFVVPYDGSNNFYKPNAVEGFLAGAKFVVEAQKEEIERLNTQLAEKDKEIESFFESLKVCQAGNRKRGEEIEALKQALKKANNIPPYL